MSRLTLISRTLKDIQPLSVALKALIFSWGVLEMLKFQMFTTEELQEISSLIAGRNLITSRRDDILADLYNQIIIELRERRTADDEHQLKLD